MTEAIIRRREYALRRARVLSRLLAATESPEFVRAVLLGSIDRCEAAIADAANVLQILDEQIDGLASECANEIRDTAPPSTEVEE